MPKIVNHDERRKHYLDALWRVVDRDGVAAVTTRSVAAEAGMSKSNVGHYFSSRSDLLAAAVAQQLDGVADELAAMDLDHCTTSTAIAAIMLALPMTPIRRNQARVWQWLVSRPASDPESAATLAELNARVRAGVDEVLAAMNAGGLIGTGRDLDVEAARLHALVDGLSLELLSEWSNLSISAIRRIVTTHVRDLAQPVAE